MTHIVLAAAECSTVTGEPIADAVVALGALALFGWFLWLVFR